MSDVIPGCARPGLVAPRGERLSTPLPEPGWSPAGAGAPTELHPGEAGSVTKEQEPDFQAGAALALGSWLPGLVRLLQTSRFLMEPMTDH